MSGSRARSATIVDRLQERFPRARILVRLDGGFAHPELLEFLDTVGVDYVIAMAKNPVLERQAERDLIVANVLSDATGCFPQLPCSRSSTFPSNIVLTLT